MQYLYHYTSIESLAMILSSGKIRFNSLSNVDDLQEKELQPYRDMGNAVLVSCWTRSTDESIPLWKMYSSDFCGVRIKLPEDMFDPGYYNMDNNGYVCLEEDPNFLIIPHDFLREVKYVKTLSDRKIVDGDKYIVGDLGREKLNVWEFQNEYRFAIYQLHDKESIDHMMKRESQLLDKNHGLKWGYYDLTLADEALNNIEVTLGPKCGAGHKVIVKALLDTYTKNGIVCWSNLREKIR